MNQETLHRARRAGVSVRRRSAEAPALGLVLGSGLSEIARSFGGTVIPYGDIEGFPATGVQGHRGELHLSARAAVMAGRYHYYEGHAMDTVCLPVLMLHELGVRTLILTNAAGGIHHGYVPGDLVLISDHLNLQGTNPLLGAHLPELGPRFPDLSTVYDPALRQLARHLDPDLREGVYAGLTGPCYETPAEIRMLRTLGADLVGMSTVPEAIVAASLGMRVLGISVVTNPAAGLGNRRLDHAEVMEAGRQAEARLGRLLLGLAEHLGNGPGAGVGGLPTGLA